jgi:AI-2 transport protein TqsA
MAEASGAGGGSPRVTSGATSGAISGAAPAAAGDAPLAGAPAARRADLRAALLVAVLVVLLGWALKAMAVVLIPLAAAILIALAVMPVRDRVRAWVPARLAWLGPAAAMALILLVLVAFFGGLWLAAGQLAGKVPEASEQVAAMLGGAEAGAGGPGVAGNAAEGAAEAVGDEAGDGGAAAGEGGAPEASGGAGLLGGATGSLPGALRTAGESALGAAGGAAASVLNAGLAIGGGLVLIFFLTLLLLFESRAWARKVEALAGRRTEWRMLESAEVVAAKVRAYVLVQTGLGAASACLYAVWLSIWGVDLILVWALLTFLMNFIPTLGSIVAGVTTTAYALITVDVGTGLIVGAGILTVEQVMGNLVAPQVQSRNIALSPFVVLVALMFWGWAWGIAGALLAVPMTFALVVVGAHVPALAPWALLLTDRTDFEGLEEATRPG